ncbi:MAG TPA: Clp protease N-terminal domain-containing protein [Thermomicrobiales bacterium]|nr:Clp protease N-terminal domain-containing protein [Thermomicrobiales bacterium]
MPGRDRFDKFTERARRVLALAQQESQRFNHNYIGTEHLLLGLLREGDGLAAQVLSRLDVQLTEVRSAVEVVIGRGERPVTGEVGMTPRAKKVLELAVDEAHGLDHHYIGTEHLLLGLMREGEGIAAGVLTTIGITLAQVREEILRELGARGESSAIARAQTLQTVRERLVAAIGRQPAGPKGNVVTCRIADADLDALDALIEAGIRTTRSDAAAWLIHAGIEANRDLFAKVYETVAEIRRLRAAAQSIAEEHVRGRAAEDAPPEPPPAGEATAPDEPAAEES